MPRKLSADPVGLRPTEPASDEVNLPVTAKRRAQATNRAATGRHPALPHFSTLAEVADCYREDIRTTRRRVASGQLRAIRLPGSRRLLFTDEEVRRLTEANTSGAA